MHENKPNFFQIIEGVDDAGSVSEYARILKKPRRTVQDWYEKALKEAGIEVTWVALTAEGWDKLDGLAPGQGVDTEL